MCSSYPNLIQLHLDYLNIEDIEIMKSLSSTRSTDEGKSGLWMNQRPYFIMRSNLE